MEVRSESVEVRGEGVKAVKVRGEDVEVGGEGVG